MSQSCNKLCMNDDVSVHQSRKNIHVIPLIDQRRRDHGELVTHSLEMAIQALRARRTFVPGQKGIQLTGEHPAAHNRMIK